MKKSERLSPVLKLEEMKEQAAVKRYAGARAQVTAETEKLQQLIGYSEEYQEMISEQGKNGITAQRLQSYHHFLNKLNQAIGQQRRQLALLEQEAQLEEQAWLRQRGATVNMDKLVSRYAQQEQLLAEKKEQKERDDQPRRQLGTMLF